MRKEERCIPSTIRVSLGDSMQKRGQSVRQTREEEYMTPKSKAGHTRPFDTDKGERIG